MGAKYDGVRAPTALRWCRCSRRDFSPPPAPPPAPLPPTLPLPPPPRLVLPSLSARDAAPPTVPVATGEGTAAVAVAVAGDGTAGAGGKKVSASALVTSEPCAPSCGSGPSPGLPILSSKLQPCMDPPKVDNTAPPAVPVSTLRFRCRLMCAASAVRCATASPPSARSASAEPPRSKGGRVTGHMLSASASSCCSCGGVRALYSGGRGGASGDAGGGWRP